MPGENCAFVSCYLSRRHKDISLFKYPTDKDEAIKKQRSEML